MGTPTAAPTESPNNVIQLGLSSTLSCPQCTIDTGAYFKMGSPHAAVSCGLADSTDTLVVVDYRAAKYDKYTFTIKLTEPGESVVWPNVLPRALPMGVFKPCNTGGTSTSLGNSPELACANSWDRGYILLNGFGHSSMYRDRNDVRYITADSSNGVPLPWEVVMKWKNNDLEIVSWKVAGSDFSYPCERGGCPDNNNNYGFTPGYSPTRNPLSTSRTLHIARPRPFRACRARLCPHQKADFGCGQSTLAIQF